MIATWLNPRRRMYVERLLEFLMWDGGKAFMDDLAYALFRARSIGEHRVDQAMDDAHALGLVEMHAVGETMVLTLLHSDRACAIARQSIGGRV